MIPPEHYVDLRDGRLYPQTNQNLQSLFAAIEASPSCDHLVVHFHGGLVSRSSADESAAILKPYYEEGGAYPVFFFWRSDILSILTGNLGQVVQEPIFQRLLKRLVQLAIGKLALGSGARAGGQLQLPAEDSIPDDPVLLAEYAQKHDLKNANGAVTPLSDSQADYAADKLTEDPVIQTEALAIAASAGAQVEPKATGSRGAAGSTVVPRASRISADIKNELVIETKAAPPGAKVGLLTLLTITKHTVVILRRVINRFVAQRDHGLYTTIVEEVLREFYAGDLGTGVWNLMKQDTLDAFGNDPTIFGGTAFLQQLGQWWKPGRRITLVGHSTGAIYIGHFLEKADAALPAEVLFDCVFLAPACTFDFLAERLPIFKKRVRRKFMFALSDEIERGYWEIPALYRGSLLYMVSGLFEAPDTDRPILGMQRYYSGKGPYTDGKLSAVVEYLGNDVAWSHTASDATWRSSAGKHGELDSDGPTLESLRAFLAGPVF